MPAVGIDFSATRADRVDRLGVQRAGHPRREAAELWASVERLIDRASKLDDLRRHGLQLLAARRWRSRGLALPDDLYAEERAYAALNLVVPTLLAKVRAAAEGPVVVMKGPAIGRFYPDPILRPFRDLDLLVADAPAVQRALVAAGFVPTGPAHLFVDIHHLRPLRWPGLPLVVEVHERPKWIEGAEAPSTTDLIEQAVPLECGVEGFLTLRPEHNALVVAAHAWAHEPLSRLSHLVDVAVVRSVADASEIEAIAQAWGVSRLWRTTGAATDALFFGGRWPFATRLWARNVRLARERTVLERQIERWAGPFFSLATVPAIRRAAGAIARDLRPRPGESWREKVVRTTRAAHNAFARISYHDGMLEARAVRRAGDGP